MFLASFGIYFFVFASRYKVSPINLFQKSTILNAESQSVSDQPIQPNQSKNNAQTPENWTLYFNREYGFKLQYPPGLKRLEQSNPKQNSFVVLITNAESSAPSTDQPLLRLEVGKTTGFKGSEKELISTYNSYFGNNDLDYFTDTQTGEQLVVRRYFWSGNTLLRITAYRNHPQFTTDLVNRIISTLTWKIE